MSQENVDFIREGYEAMSNGDVERAMANFHPDIEIRPGEDIPGMDVRDVYRGPEGFAQFLGKMSEAFEEVSWEPEDYIDAGDDVLVLILMAAVGRGSGVRIERPIAHVCTVKDGQLIRHVTYWNRQTALDAVQAE